MLSALGLHDEGADAAYEVTEMIPLDIRFYELLATSANEAVVSHGSVSYTHLPFATVSTSLLEDM